MTVDASVPDVLTPFYKAYEFIFVDGGGTTSNNPAFLAFQMATAKPYGLNWATGGDTLLVVSVGTGSAPKARPGLKEKENYNYA